MWLSETCRVCLASDREMYRLTNTTLEETYERVTSGTLVVEGRPCCVCGVCLSSLRRCRRFIDTAREANDALDRWIQNQPDTDTLKLMERPLFSFTESTIEFFEITCQESDIWQPGDKQQGDLAENKNNKILQQNESNSDDEANILTKEAKYEVISINDGDNFNIKCHNSHVLLNSECINKYDGMIDIENDMQMSDDVKFDISEMLDNVGDGTWNVGRNQESSDEDIPLKRLRSRKRVKLNEDTEKNEINEIIGEQSESASNDEDNIPIEKIKYEITSDDAINNKQSDDDKSHNSQVLSNSECINVYDEMIDIKNNTQTSDDVNYDILEKLKNVEDDSSKDESNQESSDEEIPLQRLRSRKRMLLNGDIDSDPALKTRRPMTSANLRGNTEPAALHEGQKFSCPHCDYKTTKKCSLRTHLIIHTGIKPFACDKCDYRFRQKSHLNRHLITHTEERPFACDKCNFKCKQKVDLKRHLIRHTGEKPFACNKCDYACILTGHLKSHIMRCHGEKPFAGEKPIASKNPIASKKPLVGIKSFACDKCDYKCSRKCDLNRHVLIHVDEKPFSCDICDYKCIRQISLKQHLISHTDKKPFACDKCNYKCIRKSYLQSHLMRHSHAGEKLFACDKCEFKCNHKSSLKQHFLKHTGEKLFSCDKCDYKCNLKSNLKQHLLTHTDKKPFACDECDYKCIRKSQLQSHLMIHSHAGEKLFACDKCEFKSNHKSSLNQHLLGHNGEKLF